MAHDCSAMPSSTPRPFTRASPTPRSATWRPTSNTEFWDQKLDGNIKRFTGDHSRGVGTAKTRDRRHNLVSIRCHCCKTISSLPVCNSLLG